MCSLCFRRPRATELCVQTHCGAPARHPTRYLAGLRVLRVFLARPVAGAGRDPAGPGDLDRSDWLELELWVRVSRAAFAVQPCTAPGEFEEKKTASNLKIVARAKRLHPHACKPIMIGC